MNGAFRLGVVAASARASVAPGPGPGAGFPVYLGTTQSAVGAVSNMHAIVMPATVEENDLLIVMLHNTGNRNLTSSPSGWNGIGSPAAFHTQRVNWLWKLANGTEGGATETFSFSAGCFCAAQTFRIKAGSFKPANPVAIASDAATAGLAAIPPELSPPWGAAQTLWIVAAARTRDNTSATFVDYPYPNGQAHYENGTGGNGVMHRSCYVEAAVEKLTPPPFTLTYEYDWSAFTVAVQPAA